MKKHFSFLNFHFSPQKGFTLIELLIYMGLLSILLSIISTLFAAIIDSQLDSQAVSSVDQDGRYMIAKLTNEFQSLDSESGTDSVTVPNATTLNLTQSGATDSYTLNGSNLEVTDLNGTHKLNSTETSVSDVSFQVVGDVNKPSVRVSFRLTSNTMRNNTPETKDFQTTLAMP